MQVGDGETLDHTLSTVRSDMAVSAVIDNNYWGGDQNIPKPRPSYQIDLGQ